MRYAVIYQSASGNTELIAEQIFQTIDSTDKILCDLNHMDTLPEADMYFLGFGIRYNSCSLKMLDLFEKLEDLNVKYAIFATCGFLPNERYKEKLKDNLDVWLPDTSECIDMFLCQGKVEPAQQDALINQIPVDEEKIRHMFQMGETHPDEEDFEKAEEFTRMVQKKAERG
ncbi:MAG: flavodoxin family protein [Clostridiales bacterium]|nr:flavodoxin family protein [Clostridiales bacterium]